MKIKKNPFYRKINFQGNWISNVVLCVFYWNSVEKKCVVSITANLKKRIRSIEQNVSIIDLMWLIRKKIKGKKFTGND